jgi:hypothetical protein
METYDAILDDGNLMDFSRLQTEVYTLIKNNPVPCGTEYRKEGA